MRFGLNVGYSGARVAIDINLIKEADRLGFHSVWSAEAYGSDAVTPLAWIAGQTERIHVASGIMQMPARTPAMTAMTASTLDQLSGGRFLLGLGVSGPQVVEGWHGVAYGKPLVRTREYVSIVRKIWRATSRSSIRASTTRSVPRSAGERPRQAAEEHPPRPADPDLHRRDRPEERRADGRDRRRAGVRPIVVLKPYAADLVEVLCRARPCRRCTARRNGLMNARHAATSSPSDDGHRRATSKLASDLRRRRARNPAASATCRSGDTGCRRTGSQPSGRSRPSASTLFGPIAAM